MPEPPAPFPAVARGKPLSYAQNCEDYHLSLAFAGQRDGFYVDVGGGHPVADNVSMWFYERGWRGLVVEPQDALADIYAHVRPRDVVCRDILGETEGDATLHVFPRLHGLSTTSPAHAEASSVHGDTYRAIGVKRTTLAALCRAHGVTSIDFLKVDVEGAEAEVLAGNDWTRYRPAVVVVEAIEPGSGKPCHAAWEPILLAAGYQFRLDDTLNRFYVANERTDVLAKLPAARGDWAAVTHMYEIGRAPETAEHPDHALANELTRGFWASLPMLDATQLAAFLARTRGLDPAGAEAAKLAEEFSTQARRAALARIACGYDGGQV